MKNLIIPVFIAAASCACNSEPQRPANAPVKYMGFNTAQIDSSAHVCENFFQFTAAGWIADNPIPATEARWGQFNLLAERNKERVKGLLDSLMHVQNLPKGSQAQLIGDLYASGMDSTAREQLGIQPLLPLLKEIKNIDNKGTLLPKWAQLKKWGVDAPLTVYVGPDEKNVTQNILYISQSGLGMPDRDYYLQTNSAATTLQVAYRRHVQQMFELAGFTAEEAASSSAAVYDLEYRLAEQQMSRTAQRDPNAIYNKMERTQLAKSGLPIGLYFDELGIAPKTFIAQQPDYFKFLGQLIQDVSLDTWKTYLRWQVILAFAPQLNAEFEAAFFDFHVRQIKGNKEMAPRWKRVQDAMGGLSEQIGFVYVQRYFPETSKAKIEEMVGYIKNAYRARIMQNNWMSNPTKMKAAEKLDAFTYKIGYPDKWSDYSDLDITRASYFDNLQRLKSYKLAENLGKLGQPVDKSEWYMGAHIVNAYYNPVFNEIVFPAGILQAPFFDPNVDDALNYGAIGGVIGHEFTHGFDDQGSQYDANGNLSNWWTPEDRAAFDALAQRIVEQYNAYEPLPGVFVNGQLTLGENIADLGGLTLAYHAYMQASEHKHNIPLIDGFTDQQRVFLGWAQVWQSHATEAYLRNMVLTDPHSPPQYRVNGPTLNIPEFYQAFGCDLPSKPVVIW